MVKTCTIINDDIIKQVDRDKCKNEAISQSQCHMRLYSWTKFSLLLAMPLPCFVGITKMDLQKIAKSDLFQFKMPAISQSQDD